MALPEFGNSRVQGVAGLALVESLHHGLDDRCAGVEKSGCPMERCTTSSLPAASLNIMRMLEGGKIDDTSSWHGIGRLN